MTCLVRRAFWRQILRQGFPLAAGTEHVEDGVEYFADVDIARPATALGWRDHRRKHSPTPRPSDHSDNEGRAGRRIADVQVSI
jgi:hypothetical protein